MELQSACVFAPNKPPPSHLLCPQIHTVKHQRNPFGLLKQIPRLRVQLRSDSQSLRGGFMFRSTSLSSYRELSFRVDAMKRSDEPFRGKSGSVSFWGLSHQSVEEDKLVSAPFKENVGSVFWVLGPLALVAAMVVPPYFIVPVILDRFKNETFAEILSSLITETIFYAGLAIFLLVTKHVQRPYLQFSQKRWSLLTGLRGYLVSAMFTAGIRVVLPLFAFYVTWPDLGVSSLVSVAPFLFGFLAQLAFEKQLQLNGSSCWPLVPILFEVYRIYQLTRATSYMERLAYVIRAAPTTPELAKKGGALISMTVVFFVLGVVTLWCLTTFLMRLFPSRPVAENY